MKILICDSIAEEGVKIFKDEDFEVDIKLGLSFDRLKQLIKGIHGLVVRSSTKITSEILDAADVLRVIGRAGSGLDNVDILAATRKGIIVINTPGQNSNAVAELAMAYIFLLARNIIIGNKFIKEGRWVRDELRGYELKGKTLGILGIGNIGKKLAKLAQAIKMKVIGCDPYLDVDYIKSFFIEPVIFDELLRRSDFLSIHIPKTKETIGLFNKDNIAKMKRDAYLINCARGGIIEEKALYDALVIGHLAGVALDVFEFEPVPSNSPFLFFDRVVCTPHLGANTYESQVNVAVAVAKQMSLFLKTNKTDFAVNVI